MCVCCPVFLPSFLNLTSMCLLQNEEMERQKEIVAEYIKKIKKEELGAAEAKLENQVREGREREGKGREGKRREGKGRGGEGREEEGRKGVSFDKCIIV